MTVRDNALWDSLKGGGTLEVVVDKAAGEAAAVALAELQAAGRDWPKANAVPPGAAVLPA